MTMEADRFMQRAIELPERAAHFSPILRRPGRRAGETGGGLSALGRGQTTLRHPSLVRYPPFSDISHFDMSERGADRVQQQQQPPPPQRPPQRPTKMSANTG